jgi:ferrous iron transport protein B
MLHNKRETDGITISKNTNDCYRYNYYNSIEQVDSNMFVEAAFPFNSSLSSKSICFIDTPGVNNVEDTYHRTITEETIRRNDYNAVIYVSNAQYFGTTDERALLEYLYENVRKPIVFVLNQLDKFKQKEDSIDKMLVDYDNLLNSIGFKQPVIIPVSAQAALLFKIDNTKLDEDELFEKELLQKKFEKDYYNLPQYIGAEISTALLERTGILQLERTIIN